MAAGIWLYMLKGLGPLCLVSSSELNHADYDIIKLVLRFLKNVPYCNFVFPEYIPLFYPSHFDFRLINQSVG